MDLPRIQHVIDEVRVTEGHRLTMAPLTELTDAVRSGDVAEARKQVAREVDAALNNVANAIRLEETP